jgi:hypothetical protein
VIDDRRAFAVRETLRQPTHQRLDSGLVLVGH